jgi:hypothetical protein
VVDDTSDDETEADATDDADVVDDVVPQTEADATDDVATDEEQLKEVS